MTSLQLSHTIVAVQQHMAYLMKKADEDPEGGEHEDYLIARSVLKTLQEAKRAKG
ncbi:hypothetical protein GCM10010981_30710 [Dyella nitratireducens]|uniref:Uncharacterized protein n=1 Tax=Dyella nitratireducens TaxID=1849580 RepID=A0ABQ1G9D4_9GAMM|nr:hypothetical protein GCM10010981_30710 [Dyella nitratireducens]GLQ40428.1 hypothetical protein GCM10007902_02770 [Dyella nitratireducens]